MFNVNIDGKLERAFQCSEKKDYPAAVKLCSEAISENPDDPIGYRKRSHIYARMGKWENALQDLDRVISLQCEEPADYFSRGRLRLRVANFEQAIKDFTKAIDLSEAYRDDYYIEMSRFFRAEALVRIGSYHDALTDCEHVRDEIRAYIYPRLKSKIDIVNEAKMGSTKGDI